MSNDTPSGRKPSSDVPNSAEPGKDQPIHSPSSDQQSSLESPNAAPNFASAAAAFPREGRIASIDYGTVRIGIAICDPDWILASPLEVRSAENWREDGDFYRSLLKRERIVAFVVGLPIHCDGGESEKSLESRQFALWLANETSVPVRMFDERFTTADAKNRMTPSGYTRKKEKKRIDAVAAQVLLESFLEACRYKDEIAGEPLDAKPVGGDDISQ